MKLLTISQYAAARNNLQICQMLLDRGADVYAQTDCGRFVTRTPTLKYGYQCSIIVCP